MRLIEIRVERDERLSIPDLLPSWEVGILGAMHGPEKVVIVGEKSDTRPYPTGEAEFERLVMKYGVDREESGRPWAELVLGVGPKAVSNLQEAIDAEEVKDVASVTE